MFRIMYTAAALVMAAGAQAASDTTYPAGAADPKDPRVTAYYQAKCNKMAKAQGKGEEFMAKCMKNAPETWPVGPDGKPGGGGEE